MRFCPHCNRWNIGAPLRCRYCGRTWGERICPAGHLNPADANFCGECGRAELSGPAGRTPLFIRALSFIKPIGIGLLVLVGIYLFIGLLHLLRMEHLIIGHHYYCHLDQNCHLYRQTLPIVTIGFVFNSSVLLELANRCKISEFI